MQQLLQQKCGTESKAQASFKPWLVSPAAAGRCGSFAHQTDGFYHSFLHALWHQAVTKRKCDQQPQEITRAVAAAQYVSSSPGSGFQVGYKAELSFTAKS